MLVELLEDKAVPKPGVTRVMGEWDWEYYEREHGKEATAQFRSAVQKLSEWAESKELKLPFNLNKNYTGFKLSNKVVFNVSWAGPYAWKVNVKLPEEAVQEFRGKHWEFQRYRRAFHEAMFRPLQPDAVKVDELEPFLLQAYRLISGADRAGDVEE